MATCTSCGADWGAGKFTTDCTQCGGGAMERPCAVCGGRCGETWKRAVLDSQDADEAHWLGKCALPQEEQEAIMREMLQRGET